MAKVTTLREIGRRLDKDPEHRRAYRRLQPYHDVLRAIIRRRHELELTQKELAERAGTHQSRISRIENAEYDIQFSTLVDIAEALGVRVEISFVPFEEPAESRSWEILRTIPPAEAAPTDYVQNPAASETPLALEKIYA